MLRETACIWTSSRTSGSPITGHDHRSQALLPSVAWDSSILCSPLLLFPRLPTGEVLDCFFGQGVRYLYYEERGEWIGMPLCLEFHIPSVSSALLQLAEEFPLWNNNKEMLMALRFNQYDVTATIAWKERELDLAHRYGDVPVSALRDTMALFTRAETSLALSSIARSQSVIPRPITGNARSMSRRPSNDTAAASGAAMEGLLLRIDELQQAHKRELAQLNAAHMDERDRLKAELNNSAFLVARHEQRIRDLESQAKAEAERSTAQASQLVHDFSEQISSLQRDIAGLREGGDAKNIVAEQSRTVDGLREQLNEARTRMLAFSKAVPKLAASAKYDCATLRSEQAALRELVQGQLAPQMQTLLVHSLQQITQRSATLINESSKSLMAKYRYEVMQRKLLYNKLQELKGNIRVFCRVRRDDRVECVLSFPDQAGMGTPTEIVCPQATGGAKKFEFDRVYSPASTQEEVFADTSAIMTSCVDGYNVCIIAYGQTGSGKTFTMMGTEENPGVNRRAVRELLSVCQERADVQFTITLSLMEIYNEKILDLLSASANKDSCDIHQDPVTKLPFVSGLEKREVKTVDDVVRILSEGETRRSVAATAMNAHSSRSHLLLQIGVGSFNKLSGVSATGKLTLVDLAGSERVSKTDATGQRLVEAAAINKSLSALGQVFTSLRTNQSHIPYRNSKLTHILEDSLGGDAKTCIFVNVSPAESNLAESLGTLSFGQAIRTIELTGGKPGAAKPPPGKRK
eukprot:m.746900 g.746900  ORF g.746900 m.746900 type:complete len:747 (+) comp58960_c0_seq55:289-2529(+)